MMKVRALFRLVAFAILPLVIVAWLHQNYLESRFIMKIPALPAWPEDTSLAQDGGLKIGWVLQIPLAEGDPVPQIKVVQQGNLPGFLWENDGSKWLAVGPASSIEEVRQWEERLKGVLGVQGEKRLKQAQVVPFDPLHVVLPKTVEKGDIS